MVRRAAAALGWGSAASSGMAILQSNTGLGLSFRRFCAALPQLRRQGGTMAKQQADRRIVAE